LGNPRPQQKTAFSRFPPILRADLERQLRADCVEEHRLIGAAAADSLRLGTGDSADDGRAAGDAGGAVLLLQFERHVPDDHLLRKINRFVDLSALRAHLGPYYSETGQPSIDPRVPPELIFGGQGVGELFVARNAGNLVDTATLGTLEYGAAVLGSPVIVVLAHTSCGAVKAACDVVTRNATYPGSIGPMIDPILPAGLAVRNEPGDFVTNTTKESARRPRRG
jgi:carbonic anhydrase